MLNQNSRKTHCKDGHPFDEANTIIKRTRYGGVGRSCRICQRLHDQIYDRYKRGRRVRDEHQSLA